MNSETSGVLHFKRFTRPIASVEFRLHGRFLGCLVAPCVADSAVAFVASATLGTLGYDGLISFGSTGQLTTVKVQRDDARRDSAANTADFQEMKDENEKLRFFMAAFRDVFQVSCSLLVDLMAHHDSVVVHTTLTDEVDDELQDLPYVSF